MVTDPLYRRSIVDHSFLELSSDETIRSHLAALYDTLLEQNLLRIVEPYSVVEVEYVAKVVGQERQAVELKYDPYHEQNLLLSHDRLSQMILDKILHGVLDQGRGCLILYDEPAEHVSPSPSFSFTPQHQSMFSYPSRFSLSSSPPILRPRCRDVAVTFVFAPGLFERPIIVLVAVFLFDLPSFDQGFILILSIQGTYSAAVKMIAQVEDVVESLYAKVCLLCLGHNHPLTVHYRRLKSHDTTGSHDSPWA